MSVFPRLVVSDHCAQDDDELSHDGGDRDLEGLSLAGQPLGKVAEVSVRADCGHSGHVKAGADLAAPPANSSLSALLPAVAIIGGQPGERHGGGSWDMSELREEGQDRLRGHGPDAGQRLHKAAVVAERLVAAGERANFFFDQGELLFKRRKMAFKADANRLQGGVLDPACLGLDHVLEFGAPSH